MIHSGPDGWGGYVFIHFTSGAYSKCTFKNEDKIFIDETEIKALTCETKFVSEINSGKIKSRLSK